MHLSHCCFFPPFPLSKTKKPQQQRHPHFSTLCLDSGGIHQQTAQSSPTAKPTSCNGIPLAPRSLPLLAKQTRFPHSREARERVLQRPALFSASHRRPVFLKTPADFIFVWQARARESAWKLLPTLHSVRRALLSTTMSALCTVVVMGGPVVAGDAPPSAEKHLRMRFRQRVELSSDEGTTPEASTDSDNDSAFDFSDDETAGSKRGPPPTALPLGEASSNA